MNSKDKKILMELFKKAVFIVKISTIICVVIGFLIFNFFWQQGMNVLKEVHAKIDRATTQHLEELSIPVQSGNVFTNFDNVEFTILDRQQKDNLCIVLFECSTDNVNFENIGDAVLNGKESVMSLTVSGIPKGYLNDKEKYESFIKEGIQSSEKHSLDLITLGIGYDSSSDAPGYIVSEEMEHRKIPGKLAPITDVYFDSPRLFQLVIDTDKLDGFVINSMYNYSTKLDNEQTYFDLTK